MHYFNCYTDILYVIKDCFNKEKIEKPINI